MKNKFNSKIFLVLLTAIICVSGTVYAQYKIKASEISYGDNSNVEEALNYLYNYTADNDKCISGTLIGVEEMTTSEGYVLKDNFNLDYAVLLKIENSGTQIYLWKKDVISETMVYNSNSSGAKYDRIVAQDNKIILHNFGSGNIGMTFYYMACEK